MPKEAARIFLRVVGVSVERLQDITPEDCRAEGITATADMDFDNIRCSTLTEKYIINETGTIDAESPWWKEWFSELWDSINAKSGYPWESNPWVWKISFERTEKP